MNRARVCHETFDCYECGAPIKALERFEYCGKCHEPLHVGCAEWNGSEFICPGCGDKENDECIS